MSKVEPLKDNRLKWTVHTKIEKYNTKEAFEKKEVDEVINIPGNCLCNDGVNELWALVAGGYRAGTNVTGTPTAFGVNSYIGIGDNGTNGGTAVTTQPTAGDVGLNATVNKMYMKMDDGYPIAGENQKIVFRSTFLPGIACFEWLEWTIANGNGNITTDTFSEDAVRLAVKGDEPAPDPQPVLNTAYELGVGEANVVNLNHKQENMGKKYSSATWIVTVELSLS